MDNYGCSTLKKLEQTEFKNIKESIVALMMLESNWGTADWVKTHNQLLAIRHYWKPTEHLKKFGTQWESLLTFTSYVKLTHYNLNSKDVFIQELTAKNYYDVTKIQPKIYEDNLKSLTRQVYLLKKQFCGD